ncbi:MAG: LacI family transcriptional regulator [Clostridiales bacterium 38-18]|nr:MAG: LacI family transcriptional regulator [Clostridiales bacterium 38-18]
MVTIDDIARIAGVSNTTVSNVIHGKTKRVSQKTIERIQQIIEDHGYIPNMSARALASSSSKVVALINHLDPKKSGNFLEDPFHSAFIGAVEQTLRESGYYLMIRTIINCDDLKAFLRNWNVDGLFLTGVFQAEDIYSTLSSLETPVVLIDSYLDDYKQMINIGLQDLEGGYLATKHLIENGHRKIAFACPPIREGGVVSKRLEGYKKALLEFDIPFDESIIFVREFSTSGTTELGREIAKRNDITAIFATADVMAAGIMAGIHQEGRNVPEDYSIIGFDDINWCRMTYPMLSSVHQDANLKGELAADYMMKLLEGEAVKSREIILPVSLSIRNSVMKRK